MSTNELQAELDKLRAKRKPAMTEDEVRAKAEEAVLRVAIAEEKRALREEENVGIAEQYAPSKTRRLFDYDPDGDEPAEIEYGGKTCALYTRFVIRGANADQLERHGDAVTVTLGADGKPVGAVDLKKQIVVTGEIAESCIVYPTAKIAGVSDEQHARNIKASLWHLGAARAEIGKAALELGGVDAASRRSKS